MKELSKREKEILEMSANGLLNKEIADKFGIATETVKNHVTHIIDKLGATNMKNAIYIYYFYKEEK